MKQALANGEDPTEALFEATTGGDPARVKLAAEHGAKINKLDPNGNAPIHMAVMAGDTNLVKTLIKLGANPNLADSSGMTPLLDAIEHDDVKTAQALIDAGANVNQSNSEGYTPLALAIEELRFETAKALIEAGADVNKTVGKDNLTPLMVAVAQTHLSEGTKPLPTTTRPIDIDRLLIQKGAKVNAQSNTGATALMIAAARDNAEAIGLLLNSGADPEIVNKQGQTALKIADQNDAQSAAQAIQVLGATFKRAQTGGEGDTSKQ
jgi:ankyrin repeat protein